MIPERQEHELVVAAADAKSAGNLSPRHLRPIDSDRKGAKFAALDHDVARVLGPQRGPAILYGFLASTWFEYADPAKLADRRKKFTPGDWVEVSYAQFMEIGGTHARASIIRWLRILAEECHPCPWSRCADEHPLIVVHRQGQSKSNRYRKWRCGEDTLVIRRRVKSEKLRDAALRRVAAGQILNGIDGPTATAIEPKRVVDDGQLAFLVDGETREPAVVGLKSHHETSETEQAELLEVSSLNFRKSQDGTPGSLVAELQEVLPVNALESHSETSLRGKTLEKDTDSVGCPSQKSAKPKNAAAAIEEASDEEAVACQVIDEIIALATRVQPDYPEDRAWEVARTLASSTIALHDGDCERARDALSNAIRDPRLARADNPIGLLIRGIVGDKLGRDRYLLHPVKPTSKTGVPHATSATPRYETSTQLPPGLHEALLDRIRSGTPITPEWRQERNISISAYDAARREVESDTQPNISSTPLADQLHERDPDEFNRRLNTILPRLAIVKGLRIEPNLEHPMLRGLCLAQLETELSTELP